MTINFRIALPASLSKVFSSYYFGTILAKAYLRGPHEGACGKGRRPKNSSAPVVTSRLYAAGAALPAPGSDSDDH